MNEEKSLQSLEALCTLLVTTVNKKDDEIRPQFDSLWKDFDSEKHINTRNKRGQTLLYAGCRSGRFWVVDTLIRVPGINLNGPQEGRYNSTALHGANWGGFFDILLYF
jgi:hypothetical protein